MEIYAAKQVGAISHLTDTIPNLISILRHQKIATSTPDIKYGKDAGRPYVSFSRDLTSAAERNSNKWRYGIIVDGDKLSNRYAIEPHSFLGELNSRNRSVKLKVLRAFDDGRYYMTAMIGKTTEIPGWLYNELKSVALAQPESFNKDKKFVHDIEKSKRRSFNHAYRIELLQYMGQYGGYELSPKFISDRAMSWINNHVLNETEERVSMKKQSRQDLRTRKTIKDLPRDEDDVIIEFSEVSYIDLQGCIIGLVLPRTELEMLYHPQSKLWKLLKETAEDVLPKNFRIETY